MRTEEVTHADVRSLKASASPPLSGCTRSALKVKRSDQRLFLGRAPWRARRLTFCDRPDCSGDHGYIGTVSELDGLDRKDVEIWVHDEELKSAFWSVATGADVGVYLAHYLKLDL